MLWNRDVMSALSSRSRQPQVASCLSSLLVTELAELSGKIIRTIQSRLRQSSFQKDCEVLQPFWL